MILQTFHIRHYWKVLVYYDVDFDLFYLIERELYKIGYSRRAIHKIRRELEVSNGKAVTCSNLRLHVSVVLFIKHRYCNDYLNSIIHEAEHIKQAMLESYRVIDEGETAAYTIGYLAYKLYKGLLYLLKNNKCN